MILEATTEVLKLGSSPMALLFQALLQYVNKMAARSVILSHRVVSTVAADINMHVDVSGVSSQWLRI